MHTQPNTKENSPLAIATEVVPGAPWRVTTVEPLPGFRLSVSFMDGVAGIVDMSGLVHSTDAGVFASLADPARFEQAFLEYGVVVWPGEIDLAPDAMYAAIGERGEWIL
jgi:hypothetical protein